MSASRPSKAHFDALTTNIAPSVRACSPLEVKSPVCDRSRPFTRSCLIGSSAESELDLLATRYSPAAPSLNGTLHGDQE